MSKTIKTGIIIIAMAGLLLVPACSHKDDDPKKGLSVSSEQPSPTEGKGVPDDVDAPYQTTPGGISVGDTHKSPEPQEDIKVISSEEELEEYFNSITDEEIEALFKIIEDIDISEDINPEADPGFDEVHIP